ncbi:MAG: hypothetical protein HC916_04705 [Coleofasciculaceae cyanobacterium SM2_1_6]|nr:hypothetical protein [Coleofasciculaceae cyanobacterium SM2_1_6]
MDDAHQPRETINLDQVANIEDKFINLEKIFKAQFDELQKANRHLESRISELTAQAPKLDFNEEVVTQIATRIVESLTPLISSVTTKKSSKPSKPSTIIPLDLNSASVDELSKIPNIKNKANEIIELRTRKGRFSSFDELHIIAGIKSGTTDNLRKYLVINSSDI